MTNYLEEACRARELARKYDMAVKRGSTVPGNRKRENQMILVPRGEVVGLANDCAQYAQRAAIFLEQSVAWRAYLTDVAKITPGHVTCEKCGQIHIPLPESGECPFCRITSMSGKQVTSRLMEMRGIVPDE